MPSVTLNRKVFEKLVGKKLSDDKLKDRISMLGTDLDELTADEIHVEIFPNRPDMLSEQGFARAFSSFIGQNTGLRKYPVNKSNYKVIVEPSVKEVRPYTACAVVKGLKFTDERIREVIQIQEKLHITYGRNRKKTAIGIYPFEVIKPPIRFIALKPTDINFQPLESKKSLTGLQILSQHPAGRDYGHLLEGKNKFPIFVDANDEVLSMPPIINSDKTGRITQKTTDVFIETSGHDYEVCAKCLNIIVTALADMGGDIYSMEIDVYGKKIISPDLKPSEIKVNLNYINKRLGLNLADKDAKKYLERMGYGYKDDTALIPSYRADILHQIDLAEDIAIAYGYENIPEVIPKVATIAKENDFEIFKRKVSEILAGVNLIECRTYHITNNVHQKTLMETKIETIELANALNREYSVLTSWHIPSLMEVLKNNKHHEYPQNIFTIGRVFKKNSKEETNILEQDRLAILICQDNADYTKIKQILDYLLRMINIEYSIQETDHSSFIPGRVGRVSVDKKKIAYIGEISPKVLDNFDLDMPVAAFELNLTEIFEIMKKN